MARRIIVSIKPSYFQRGAALILMAFILGLGVAAYLLKTFDAASLRAKQDAKTYQTLKEAKSALIAWAVNYSSAPGQMPWPDRNGDGNYDGSSDCVTGTFDYRYLLGLLPSMPTTSPCLDPNNGLNIYTGLSTYSGLGREFRDAQGNRLWYAVSRNIVRNYQTPASNPEINPSLINKTTDWIKVLDRNGNLISDRVAAVLIAPGAPVGSQSRSSDTPPPDQYLDRIVRASDSQPFKNYGYPTNMFDDNQFIMGEDSRTMADSDNTFQKPYYFNDKLVYITVNELMVALEKRVAAEVKVAMLNYKQSTSYMPYAAIMGGHKNYSCVDGKLSGALPIAPSHSSSCSFTGVSSTSSTSSCSFSEVDSIIFTKTGSNFTSSTDACQFAGKICTCSGSGSCRRTTRTFICNAAGVCSANMSGTYQFIGGGFDSVTGKCSSSCGSDVTCSGTGGGSFSHSNCTDSAFNDAATNSKLPTWFIDNQWQDYIYYAAQRGASPTFIAGGKSGIKALTVTTGFPIVTAPFAMSKGGVQSHLSCKLSDSLDTDVNVSGSVTNMYEPLNKPRTSNYNDQIFVISP